MNQSPQYLRPGLVLGVLLAVASLAVTTQSSLAAEKSKEQQISRVIAKEMTAAQKALQASQWQEALKNLEAAEQKSPLTPFDKKTIYDFKGFANVRLNKLKEAESDYEQAIATGQYSAEDAAKTTRMLFRLSAGNQQYAKALEYGKQVSDAGSANADDLAVMSQIYYLQKDCKNSAVWADKAISAARKAGEAPKENLFQFKLQCASDAGDNGAMATVLVDLIKLTNKTNYWNTLLRIERQDERDDHNLLMIYRAEGQGSCLAPREHSEAPRRDRQEGRGRVRCGGCQEPRGRTRHQVGRGLLRLRRLSARGHRHHPGHREEGDQASR